MKYKMLGGPHDGTPNDGNENCEGAVFEVPSLISTLDGAFMQYAEYRIQGDAAVFTGNVRQEKLKPIDKS